LYGLNWIKRNVIANEIKSNVLYPAARSWYNAAAKLMNMRAARATAAQKYMFSVYELQTA
jgi:hypothetical protein